MEFFVVVPQIALWFVVLVVLVVLEVLEHFRRFVTEVEQRTVTYIHYSA